MTAYMVHSTI